MNLTPHHKSCIQLLKQFISPRGEECDDSFDWSLHSRQQELAQELVDDAGKLDTHAHYTVVGRICEEENEGRVYFAKSQEQAVRWFTKELLALYSPLERRHLKKRHGSLDDAVIIDFVIRSEGHAEFVR